MITTTPRINRTSMRTGTHGGLTLVASGPGGVYRDEALGRPELGWPAPAGGVIWPPDFFFGGATQGESRHRSGCPFHGGGRSLQGHAVGVTKVLVIDSYDSFVYNLVQYLGELGAEPIIVRNDQATVEELLTLGAEAVLVSPGPGRPEHSGVICEAIRAFGEDGVPVLGVCLGHQAIGHVYGAGVVRAPEPMHGKTSEVDHDGAGIFRGLRTPLTVTRYHSLILERSSVPPSLQVTATSSDGVVMGVRHREFPIEGIQFHPESILTEEGHSLLAGFLHITRLGVGG